MSTFEHIADAALTRTTGTLDHATFAYVSDGGTWMLASHPRWNDDGKPHDLAAVLRDGTVLALRPTVNPELIQQLREAFASASEAVTA